IVVPAVPSQPVAGEDHLRMAEADRNATMNKEDTVHQALNQVHKTLNDGDARIAGRTRESANPPMPVSAGEPNVVVQHVEAAGEPQADELLAEAEMMARHLKAKSGHRHWGLFEDSPDKLLRDIQK